MLAAGICTNKVSTPEEEIRPNLNCIAYHIYQAHCRNHSHYTPVPIPCPVGLHRKILFSSLVSAHIIVVGTSLGLARHERLNERHGVLVKIIFYVLYLAIAALVTSWNELLDRDLGDDEDLQRHDEDDDDEHGDLHREHLGVGRDEAEAGGPVKGRPCVAHADDALATYDLRNDLGAEAAIEGNDGLFGIVEQRGLHAGQDHVRWDYKAECEDETEDEDGERLQAYHGGAATGHVGCLLLELAKVVHPGEDAWQEEGQLLSNSEDGSWKNNLLVHAQAWDAAPPGLGARLRNHDVRPGHGHVGHQHGGNDASDAAWEEGNGRERERDEGEEDRVDDEDAEPPEPRWEAALGVEEFQGAAERGGDGLLLGRDRLGLDRGTGLIGIGIDGGKRLEEGIGRLDDKQRGDEAAEGVIDLAGSVSLAGAREEHGTYHHHDEEEADEGRHEHEHHPGGQLDHGSVRSPRRLVVARLIEVRTHAAAQDSPGNVHGQSQEEES